MAYSLKDRVEDMSEEEKEEYLRYTALNPREAIAETTGEINRLIDKGVEKYIPEPVRETTSGVARVISEGLFDPEEGLLRGSSMNALGLRPVDALRAVDAVTVQLPSKITGVDPNLIRKTFLAKGAIKGLSNIKPSTFGITTKTTPYYSSVPKQIPQKGFTRTGAIDVTTVKPNKGVIPSETYGGLLEKYPFLVKGVQSTVANTNLTNIKPGQPYAMASVLGVNGDVSKNLGLDFSGDTLTKSVQPISEILPHKSIRESGGVSLYDPDQAGAIQQLITQKIHTAMDAGPKFVTEMFEEIWPNVDTSTLTTQQMKKKLTIALGSKTKAGGPVATSNLDRGLAEILVGDKEFLHQIGVIDEVVNSKGSVLEPKNISKWLGAIDSRVSSTTDGVALHHSTLTSSKPVLDSDIVKAASMEDALLDPMNVNAQWRGEFLSLVREKVIPGAEGIVKQDALAHKPFSSPKIKNKSGKLVADNTKWVVKGVLGDVLEEFKDFPKSATGDILVNKEVSKIGDWSKGLEGQLQKVIRSINDKAAHASWSHGTTGWTLDPRLAQYLPEDAFSVAEYIFDLERTVSAQGIRVTQVLNRWKDTVSKGDFGNPPNLEKAVADLQRKIDNIRIDKSRIKSMEEAYQIRLDILLEKGPEALREFNAKASLGPRPAPDPVKSMNK